MPTSLAETETNSYFLNLLKSIDSWEGCMSALWANVTAGSPVKLRKGLRKEREWESWESEGRWMPCCESFALMCEAQSGTICFTMTQRADWFYFCVYLKLKLFRSHRRSFIMQRIKGIQWSWWNVGGNDSWVFWNQVFFKSTSRVAQTSARAAPKNKGHFSKFFHVDQFGCGANDAVLSAGCQNRSRLSPEP